MKELNKNDIVEIRGIGVPSEGVKKVTESLCILFKIPPEKKRGQTAKEGTIIDYWEPAKKKLLLPTLLK